MLGAVQVSADEGVVDDFLCLDVSQGVIHPDVDALLDGSELTLDSVNADSDGVHEGVEDVLRVLLGDGEEIAVERQVVTHEDTEPGNHPESEALVMGVPQSED